MVLHAYFNPRGLSGVGVVNTAAWRQSAIPSTNGHATARAVAAFYAALLPGAQDRILGPALVSEATTPHSEGNDIVLERPTRFGLGFGLHLDERPIGTTAAAFGHYGFGGSLGFADPDAGHRVRVPDQPARRPLAEPAHRGAPRRGPILPLSGRGRSALRSMRAVFTRRTTTHGEQRRTSWPTTCESPSTT